jgi:hypothetical protein
MAMKNIVIVIAAILIMLAGMAGAKEVKLKKSFFAGWKYSVDGIKYKSVGVSGSSLRDEMGDNEAAVGEMKKYESNSTAGVIFGSVGGFLIGWPLGAALAGNRKDGYGAMMAVGGGLAVVSIVFDATATGHLKRAVRIYNGEEQGIRLEIDSRCTFAGKADGLTAKISWQF